MQYTDLALRFVNALADGRFNDAHLLLSSDLREEQAPVDLRSCYDSMIEYGGNPASKVELVDEDDDLDAEDHPSGVGWAFISIVGPFAEERLKPGVWVEAVAVVVSDENGRQVISDIQWGNL